MFETLPQLICENYKNHPENQIQLSKNKKGVFVPVKYKEFYTDMTNFAAGLYSLGEGPHSNIGLISDDRKRFKIQYKLWYFAMRWALYILLKKMLLVLKAATLRYRIDFFVK